MASSEVALVERAKRGDTAAFEQLVALYEKKVYNLAYQLTGNPEDAADVAQEAFVRAYMHLGEFRGDSSFGTWITHVVVNICRDEWRRRQRRPTASLQETVQGEDDEMTVQYADPGETPDQAVERAEEVRLVWQVLDQLDPEHREVLVLREFQEMSYDDIARALGCNLGTVKSRLSRARQAFKELYSRALELLSPGVVYKARRRRRE